MTSQYLRNYTSKNEQELISSLVAEAINLYGIDIFYIKRVVINSDAVIEDDKLSKYTAAYPTTAYIKNIDGFAGDGTFLSKFGLEVRDQVTLTISVKGFTEDVIQEDPSFIRPREGDVIWFSLQNKLYEVKYVDQKTMMNQFGNIQAWDLTCEVAEYNNEIWDTGYEFLDNIFAAIEVDVNNIPFLLLTPDGIDYIVTNDGTTPITYGNTDPSTVDTGSADNSALESAGEDILDFSERNPFGNANTY